MKQTGFILLTTMIIVLVSALLVVSLMKSVFLYSKECRQVMASHQAFHALETVVMRLDLNQTSCFDEETNPNQLIANLVANKGCTRVDGKRKYTYSISNLGVHPCLSIFSDKAMHSSHHWRITITDPQLPSRILQLRIAKPSDVVALCELPEEHRIHEGVISWRFVSVVY